MGQFRNSGFFKASDNCWIVDNQSENFFCLNATYGETNYE